MEHKESKTIELATNPKRVYVLDKADTQERIEQLEKKLQKTTNTANKLLVASGVGIASSVAGILTFFGASEKVGDVALVAGLSTFVASTVSMATNGILNKRAEKLEIKLEQVRKSLSLREIPMSPKDINLKLAHSSGCIFCHDTLTVLLRQE